MTQTTATSKNNTTTRYRLLLGLIVLGYVILQLIVVNTQPLTYDEGINLQISHFIGLGHSPYTEIFTLSGPLFVWFIGWSGKLGLSVVGTKLLFLLFGLLLLVTTASITRRWFGDWPALAATFLLATATTFTVEAAAVINIIPAVWVAMVSLLLTFRRKKLWLFLAGAVWGVALFISISVVSVGLTALLIIIFTHTNTQPETPQWQPKLLALAAWLAGAALILMAGQLLVGNELSQVFNSYATIRSNLTLNQAGNFVVIGQFLTFNLWLSLPAIYAVAQFYNQANHTLWLVLIWLLLSFLWLMVQMPLRAADVAILLPPLAILAGWGVTDAGHRLADYIKSTSSNRRSLWIGLIIGLAALYLLVSWQRFNEHYLRNVDTGDDFLQIQQVDTLARFIQQYTDAADCVIIDDPALAIVANRYPTPWLVDLSETRLSGGLVDIRQLVTLITEADCSAVVLSRREYHEYLLGYEGWLQDNYPNTDKFIRTQIYYK